MGKQDTVISISPNGSIPAPFRMAERYRWEYCDDPDYEGFGIEARTGLTNAERDALQAAHADVQTYNAEWLAQSEEDRDQVDTPRRRELDLVAPFIRAWNVVGVDAVTGADKAVPPPVDGGPEAFELIEKPMESWVIRAVLTSFLLGRGLNRFPRVSDPSVDLTFAGKTGDPS